VSLFIKAFALDEQCLLPFADAKVYIIL